MRLKMLDGAGEIVLAAVKFMNDTFNIDNARLELVTCEARAKQLRKLVEEWESLQKRYEAIFDPLQTSARPAPGLADTVLDLIAGSPDTVFTTAQLRQLLAGRGFNVRPRNFGSSLSTTLTRLGNSGFVIIGSDADGNRTYKRKMPDSG